MRIKIGGHMLKQAKITVTGLVQGVNFRYDAAKQADKLGLKGYAKNLETGNQVEIVIQDDEEGVSDFIKWCKSGTVYSRIENVEVLWEKPKKEYKDFEILY